VRAKIPYHTVLLTLFFAAAIAGWWCPAGISRTINNVENAMMSRDMQKPQGGGGLYVMTLGLRNPFPIPEPYRGRWEGSIIKETGEDAAYIIFLAEVLGIVEGTKKVTFSCNAYSTVDMFGGQDRNWTISTEAAKIHRAISAEIRESWSSLRYDADVTEISGIPGGQFITWSGNVGAPLEIGTTSGEKKDAIVRVAHDLFKDVIVEEKGAPLHSRLRSDLQMGKEPSKSPAQDEIEGLIFLTADKDDDVAVAAFKRLQAYELLGKPQVIPVVSKAITDGSSVIRRAAAALPGKNRDKVYLPVLMKALRDGDSSVEEAAIGSLRDIGDPSAVPALLAMMKHTLGEVRKMAIITVGEIATPNQASEVVGKLIPFLNDESHYVRDVTVSVLSHYRDDRLINPFIARLKDNYEWVRKEAAEALGEWGDRKAVPALIKALDDNDRWVVIRAIEALGKIGDSRARAPLAEILKKEKERGGDEKKIQTAQEALKKLP
jgi:HEAT repeat protein